jgi:hypothetical protein
VLKKDVPGPGGFSKAPRLKIFFVFEIQKDCFPHQKTMKTLRHGPSFQQLVCTSCRGTFMTKQWSTDDDIVREFEDLEGNDNDTNYHQRAFQVSLTFSLLSPSKISTIFLCFLPSTSTRNFLQRRVTIVTRRG